MDVEIKKLSPLDVGQFVELIRVFEDVFEMKDLSIPDKDHLRRVLETENFLAFVAISDGKVLGGLTAHVLQQYYSSVPQIYIYDLGVKTAFQRQGIGRSLISAVNSHGKLIGAEEAFVQAELEDEDAIAFYRSTRPADEERALHFSYIL